MVCRIPHRHWLHTYRSQRYITDCINDEWLSFLIRFQKGTDVAASILWGSERMIFIVTHVDSMASHFATYRLASLRTLDARAVLILQISCGRLVSSRHFCLISKIWVNTNWSLSEFHSHLAQSLHSEHTFPWCIFIILYSSINRLDERNKYTISSLRILNSLSFYPKKPSWDAILHMMTVFKLCHLFLCIYNL